MNLEINLDNKFRFNILDDDVLELIEDANAIPEDFFSDNINITCLLGKNGSGKTRIMSLLTSFGAGEFLRLNADADFFAILRDESKYYYLNANYGNMDFKSGVVNYKKSPSHIFLENDNIQLLKNYQSFYLSSNNTNMIKSGYFSVENDFSVGNEKRFKGLHNIVEVLHFIKLIPFDVEIGDICNSKKIRLVISDQWLGMLNIGYLFGNGKDRKNFTSMLKRLKRNGQIGFPLMALLVFLRILSTNMHKKSSSEISYLHSNFLNELNSVNIINTLYSDHSRLGFEPFEDFFIFKGENSWIKDLCFFISESMVYDEKGLSIEFQLDSKSISFLEIILKLSFENGVLADGCKFYIYPPFSTGQWKRVELVSKILSLDREPGQVVNLFIDEPDADLHPELQARLVSWLINLMEGRDKYFNIILSTHNPLILSDFPRRRVVYIGDNKPNNTKVKTLGANVYNLYKDSFLMPNAISDFIKRKIESSIRKKDVSGLTFLVNEISEPLIVRTLQAKLNEIRNDGRGEVNSHLDDFINGLSQSDIEALKRKLNHE
jgi:hypothetical protein